MEGCYNPISHLEYGVFYSQTKMTERTRNIHGVTGKDVKKQKNSTYNKNEIRLWKSYKNFVSPQKRDYTFCEDKINNSLHKRT